MLSPLVKVPKAGLIELCDVMFIQCKYVPIVVSSA